MRIAHVLAASAVLVCTTAFAQSQQMQGQQGSSNAGIPAPKNIQELAQGLHSGNQMEIKMGQLAQQQGNSPEVKQFGQKMVQDHQQLDQQLMQYAKQKNWKLTSNAKPSSDVEKAFEKRAEDTMALLKQLHGQAFDTQFMSAMVADHDKNLLIVGEAIKQFQSDPFSKTLSQVVVPKFSQHRQSAYQILGDLQPKMEQMGVGGAGMGSQSGKNQ